MMMTETKTIKRAINVRIGETQPQADEEWQAATIWDKHAEAFIETFDLWEKIGSINHAPVAQAIVDENPDSVLEIGSGTGLLYRNLLKKGYIGKYLGIDRTKSFIEYSTNLYGDGLFKQGKAEDVKITGKFDVCIMEDVLRHNRLVDRPKILENIVPHIRKKMIMKEPLGEEDTEMWSNATMPLNAGPIEVAFWDGSINVLNLVATIDNIKKVKDSVTIPIGGAYADDQKTKMYEHFIVVLFKEE
jgi:SAM-dependent methyltransferase